MSKNDENKLAMLKAVLRLLKKYQSEWQNTGSFAVAVAELESIIAQIEATRENTDTDQTGPVAEKKSIQKMLIDKAFEIISQLSALAKKTKDQVLEANVNYTKSDLILMRESVLASTSKSVVKIGREKIAPLSEYNIGNDDLNLLENMNNQFIVRLPAYRVAISGRKADNIQLKLLIKSGNQLIKEQINLMMTRYEKTNPTFYAAYFNTIKVVNYGIRHEKPEEPEKDNNKPAV
jgi:hypothetical protein